MIAYSFRYGIESIWMMVGWIIGDMLAWRFIHPRVRIVILYSFAGGIRADIWRDAAQSFVMILSMGLILIAGTMEVGGWSALALLAHEGVFGLVLIAWSVLGAGLGPPLVIRLVGLPLPQPLALSMMITAVVVSLWHISPYNDDVFKALPGTLAALAVYVVGLTGSKLFAK